jgi:hypothetical protein
MNKTEIMNKLSRSFHRTGLKLKKYSPEILVTVGVVGAVTGAVMACKATTKASVILDEAKERIDAIKEVAENPEMKEKYSEEDRKKDLAIVYTQTGVELAKTYGPAILIGVASASCIFASVGIMHKRNVALAAAYATVDKGFKEYRGRVVERFGKELDRELKYNIKAKEIEEIKKNEDGTEEIVKTTVQTADINEISEYARYFDEYCVGWEKDPELNLYYVRMQQAYANDLLKARGHVFLNEVYDMFGIPRTKAGAQVGWVYSEKTPGIYNDDYIDFGVYDITKESNRDFVNGRERSILLEFNVDGYILDLI